MSAVDQVKFRKFDMSRIKHTDVVVLIGMRETGKTFLVKDLMWHHQDIPCGIVITGTEKDAHNKLVPPMFIHDEFNPLILTNVLRRQKFIANKIGEEIRDSGTSSRDPRTFIVMDDCLYDETWTQDKNVRSLFMNSRNYRTMFIITMQYAMGIPPPFRLNVDFVFILRENITHNRRKLYETWAGMFPDFDSFCRVMDQCTENYECLVIDNTTTSTKLEDQVFWYKATSHPDFRLCSPELWGPTSTGATAAADEV